MNLERIPVVEQRRIPKAIVEKALELYPDAQFKLQSIQQLFIAFLKGRAQVALSDGKNGVSGTWKEDFIALLEQEF